MAVGVVVASIDKVVDGEDGRVDKVVVGRVELVGVREGKDGVVEGAGLKGVKVKPNFFFPAALVGGGGVGGGTT